MHPLDQDTSTIPLITYQPSLLRKKTTKPMKKFTAEYRDRVEKYDTFAEAHGRVQRLKRMGVKAVVGASES